ncbi:MAG: hypothetical protein WB660_13215 [Candidatus Sulfotelmatobacter sp.]
MPSLDGKKLFVQGMQPHAELVRYDAAAKQFLPFLGGISVTDAAFTRDGKWVAYVATPGNTLWRSRVDGSERLQLTLSTRGSYASRLVSGWESNRLRFRPGRKAMEDFADFRARRLARGTSAGKCW